MNVLELDGVRKCFGTEVVLSDVSLAVPRHTATALIGASGSGKSTLAFDIVFNEGQRRYLESLNAYARQFVQPASRHQPARSPPVISRVNS